MVNGVVARRRGSGIEHVGVGIQHGSEQGQWCIEHDSGREGGEKERKWRTGGAWTTVYRIKTSVTVYNRCELLDQIRQETDRSKL